MKKNCELPLRKIFEKFFKKLLTKTIFCDIMIIAVKWQQKNRFLFERQNKNQNQKNKNNQKKQNEETHKTHKRTNR